MHIFIPNAHGPSGEIDAEITGDKYGIDSTWDDLTVTDKHGALIQGGFYAIGSVANDLTLVNDGTIKGGTDSAVHGGSDSDTVTNSGKIIGDVTLGAGNDTFISKTLPYQKRKSAFDRS